MRYALITAILISVISYKASGQRYSATSKPKSFNITKEVKPPILNIVDNSIEFTDKNGNNAIDANEACTIELAVCNSGMGTAYGCQVQIEAQGTTSGLVFNSNTNLNPIKVGDTLKVRIPINARMQTEDGTADFKMLVFEPNGFGTDPQHLIVNTRAFVAPMLKVTDYTVTGVAATLKKKQPFDLQILLQNTDYGDAEDITVTLVLPEGIILIDGQKSNNFPSMKAGETRSLVYSLIANNNYSSNTIPIQINIREKYGSFSESKTINLSLNQSLSSNKIVINEIEEEQETIRIASLMSDVDKDIPVNPSNNASTFVVIIANENYRREAKVDYALNDGKVFSQYCHLTLGIPENNIQLYANATLNDMRAGINWLNEVAKVYSGQANLILYYAGHGIPDESDASAYLLPTDGSGSDVQSGYKLSELYDRFSLMPAKSVVVFIDACFSGAQRGDEMLTSARGVAIRVKEDIPERNMVVFSAAQEDETAYPYDSQSHGLFTYYLLKHLQESEGNCTLGEMADYLNDNVRKRSIVDNKKSQTPTVTVSPDLLNTWRDMTLR